MGQCMTGATDEDGLPKGELGRIVNVNWLKGCCCVSHLFRRLAVFAERIEAMGWYRTLFKVNNKEEKGP